MREAVEAGLGMLRAIGLRVDLQSRERDLLMVTLCVLDGRHHINRRR